MSPSPSLANDSFCLKRCRSITSRVAIPFGGFSKTSRQALVKSLQVEPLPDYPEIQGSTSPNRTSFNGSAQGWTSAGGPVPVPMVPLERVLIPESDDL